MTDYIPIIGLEIHAELTTNSKLFCRCPNTSSNLDTPPNTAICPVCVGLPGALPVLNRAAVSQLIKLGTALGCAIPESTKWDRKNYFYPDLPKGYQISQYDEPICGVGTISWQTTGRETQSVALTRIHLEEDTGKLIHPVGSPPAGGSSLIDYNRSSIPLIELVTEPDLASAEETKLCAQEYQHVLHDLGVSEASMEKGQMRCEANISVIPEAYASDPSKRLSGTKVEIKNLNSFRSLERAVEYEIKRQTEMLQNGESVIQQTRGWNEDRSETYIMREKETASDYRYFPEPDLGRLDLTSLKQQVGTVRLNRHEMLTKLQAAEVDTKFISIVLGDPDRFKYLTALLPLIQPGVYNLAIQWISQEPIITRHKIDEVAQSLTRIKSGQLRSSVFKDALLKDGDDSLSNRIESRLNSNAVTDLDQVVSQVLKNNPMVVERYKNGQKQLLGFFIGEVKKMLQGKGDPVNISHELTKQLDT